ncbi:hypothetical protein CYMTET_28232, partial [Cymbomonas tetramitiformis]
MQKYFLPIAFMVLLSDLRIVPCVRQLQQVTSQYCVQVGLVTTTQGSKMKWSIKLGDEIIYNRPFVYNNSEEYYEFVCSLDDQLSYTFEMSNTVDSDGWEGGYAVVRDEECCTLGGGMTE